jgi:hypothetical protein
MRGINIKLKEGYEGQEQVIEEWIWTKYNMCVCANATVKPLCATNIHW